MLRDGKIRTIALLSLLCTLMMPTAAAQPLAPAFAQNDTLILANPDDPYYVLAEEIAQRETLPIVHTLDQVMAQNPVFLLWVVSPTGLSDQVLVDFGLQMRDRQSAISVGIISGTTLGETRDLWLRASEVKGERVFAVNAANPSGHIEAKIVASAGGETTIQHLNRESMVRSLQQADYLTFTGHGGTGFLGLEQGVKLQPGHIPDLHAVVIATGSCNTFRIWESSSIALGFVSKGAAAYAGFAFTPNEGYLIGEFQGLPFRYTWPDFPIGHVVQVQNHGTLQGFAQFPYYHLLGDPRIALQAEAPYRLMEDRVSEDTRTLTYADALPGFIPVRIAGGASYSFVEIPGVSAAWDHDPFYNARLQMVDIQNDKFVLFAHQGGDFTLRLRSRPPWHWVVGDVLTDALDNTLLYLQETGGDVISMIAAGMALVAVTWLLLRKKASTRTLIPAALTGFGFAVLHGLYALAHEEKLTVTSKSVGFSPLSLVAAFLLAGCGAFLFLNTKSWRGKVVALLVASFGALAPAVFALGVITLMNVAFFRPKLGVGLYNYTLGLQALIVLAIEWFVFGLIFFALDRSLRLSSKEAVNA